MRPTKVKRESKKGMCEPRRLSLHPGIDTCQIFSRAGCVCEADNPLYSAGRGVLAIRKIHMLSDVKHVCHVYVIRSVGQAQGREGASVPCSEAQRKLLAAAPRGRTLWVRKMVSWGDNFT